MTAKSTLADAGAPRLPEAVSSGATLRRRCPQLATRRSTAPGPESSAFNVWVILRSLFFLGDVALTVMSIVEIAGGGTLLR